LIFPRLPSGFPQFGDFSPPTVVLTSSSVSTPPRSCLFSRIDDTLSCAGPPRRSVESKPLPSPMCPILTRFSSVARPCVSARSGPFSLAHQHPLCLEHLPPPLGCPLYLGSGPFLSLYRHASCFQCRPDAPKQSCPSHQIYCASFAASCNW